MNSKYPGTIVVLAALAMAGCSENATRPVGRDLAADRNRPGLPDQGCGDLPVAPEDARVDLVTPAFTAPTDISNPLFPVGGLERALFGGLINGERFRTETTLLRGTRTITVDGEEIETIVSQYVAWLDRRIDEVALDWYGEDDDGNVWYLGEDVFNYEDGVVVDRNGTWIAGVDGPPAMIMPADPRVGNVWRPENACPIVFEEVTAIETGVTVPGPQGPIGGCIIVRELHMDGTTEDKIFAPGYGEFSTGSGENIEAIALAIPINALPGEAPEELEELSDGAEWIFQVARKGNWRRLAARFEEMVENWDDYEDTGVPPRIAVAMSDALEALQEEIGARDSEGVRQASVDVALAALDFELQYDDRREIDFDLIEIWNRQLQIDVRARDRAGVRSDLETIRIIRDRLKGDRARGLDADLAALFSVGGDDEATLQVSTRLSESLARRSGTMP